MEGALARFPTEKHGPTDAYGSVQVLLRGLSDDDLQPPAHAVQSVDWYWPTSGELEWTRTQGGQGDRRATLAAERRTAATACRAALAGDPSITARFDPLLPLAPPYPHLPDDHAG